MQLNISKRIVKAGDIVDVTWDAQEGTNPRLILETGNRQSTLSVPAAGSKRFRLKGSKGRHSITLITDRNGREKSLSRRIFVYGKAPETDEFEYVDRGDASPLNRWNNAVRNWWAGYTPERKRLYILLISLLAIHSLGSIPSLSTIAEVAYYVLIFWLFWQVVKRD